MIGFNNKKIGFIVDTSFGNNPKMEDVKVVPLGVTVVDGKDIKPYKDGEGFDIALLMKAFANKNCNVKTSQASMPDMMNAAMEMSKEYDEIFVFPIQKALSGNFNTWNIIKEDFPKLKVIMSNTIANTFFWLLNDFKKALLTKSMSEAEAQVWFDDESSRMVGFLLVQDMGQLVKGGRVSGFKAGLAKLFGVKPIIRHDNTGLQQWDKTKSYDGFLSVADEYIAKKWPGKKIINELILVQNSFQEEVKEYISVFKKHHGRMPQEVYEQAVCISSHAGAKSCSYMVRVEK